MLRCAITALALLLVAGCAKREQALSTGATIPAQDLLETRADRTGSSHYAVVQSGALPDLYAGFRATLSRQGLVRWDERFDCNHFAALYIALAQTRFAVAAWHSETPAQSLALAEVWYYPDAGGYHAIVQARTERGDIFIEPQTGQEIQLSATERTNITFRKW